METLYKKHRVLLFYTDNKSVTKMQKPDKIYLHNPNMHYALSTEENTDPMVKQEEDGITPGNALSRRRNVWDD